jgi:glycosyl hydrolase family 36/glycosyl transferase family 36
VLVKRLLIALALLTALPGTASAAPAPLSADTSMPSLDSSYGSGNFGHWGVDSDGLPTFSYELDHMTDPRGAIPETPNRRRAQHQLGNDNVVATAWNDGYTMLWSQSRLMQFVNLWEADNFHWAGGYGYLRTDDGKVLSTLYLDRPQGSEFDRVFGTGYYRKRMRAEGLEVREDTYAPFGDDPVLLHDVHIENVGTSERRVSWFEYWDVNPFDRSHSANRGISSPQWDAERQMLTVDQANDYGDTDPETIFAAALTGDVSGYDTLIPAFFGTPPSRQRPAAVVADQTTESIAPPTPAGSENATLFAMRTPLTLAPGEAVTLRYAYGLADADRIEPLVDKYAAAGDPLAESQARWKDWLPRADFGAGDRYVARELAWDAYLLRTATVYEEECGAHTITQGGYYQYTMGFNLGYRSWLHYMLPIAYTEPELAREILRYSIKLQPEVATDGFVPYGTGPLCQRFDLGTSNDLDFWLLLAAGEYGLGTRDVGFFDEQLPYYDTQRDDSAWEHIKRSYRHQESMRGPNGGYVMGSTGDWSDFATPLGPMTESLLVAAQLAYAYPKLAELADLRGDDAFAAELRARAAELRQVVADNWVEKGWYSRGWFGNRQIGKGVIYGEPQPWAILAGVPSDDQAATLVENIREHLTGIGAPGGPSRIGSAMAPSRKDPDMTEHGPAIDPTEGSLPDVIGAVLEPIPNAPFAGAAAYPGGVWFDINGHLTWALTELDGRVPGAADLAWDEYTRNTLARHANEFPDHWNGTISVDDACNAWYSSDPSRCGIGIPFWIGQITEQPTWIVMNAIRLAGVTPTRDGYRIAPHLPQQSFNLRFERVGVAREAGALRGYVTPEQDGPIELRVRLDGGASQAYVDGERVAHAVEDGYAVFTAPGRADEPLDWALAPKRSKRRN